MSKAEKVLDQLDSWQKGYLPPSAQILMRDAYNIVLEQTQEIVALKEEIESLKLKAIKSELTAKLIKKRSKTKDNEP
jgi:hypothetical protein